MFLLILQNFTCRHVFGLEIAGLRTTHARRAPGFGLGWLRPGDGAVDGLRNVSLALIAKNCGAVARAGTLRTASTVANQTMKTLVVSPLDKPSDISEQLSSTSRRLSTQLHPGNRSHGGELEGAGADEASTSQSHPGTGRRASRSMLSRARAEKTRAPRRDPEEVLRQALAASGMGASGWS